MDDNGWPLLPALVRDEDDKRYESGGVTADSVLLPSAVISSPWVKEGRRPEMVVDTNDGISMQRSEIEKQRKKNLKIDVRLLDPRKGSPLLLLLQLDVVAGNNGYGCTAAAVGQKKLMDEDDQRIEFERRSKMKQYARAAAVPPIALLDACQEWL